MDGPSRDLFDMRADELLSWPAIGPVASPIISVDLFVVRRERTDKKYNPSDFEIALLRSTGQKSFYQLVSSPMRNGETSHQAITRALQECTGLSEVKITKISSSGLPNRVKGVHVISMLFFVSVDTKARLRNSLAGMPSSVPEFVNLGKVLRMGNRDLPFALEHRQMIHSASGWLEQKFITGQINNLFIRTTRRTVQRVFNPMHHSGYQNKMDEPIVLYNNPYFASGALKPKAGSQRLAPRVSDRAVKGTVDIDVTLDLDDEEQLYDHAHQSFRRAPGAQAPSSSALGAPPPPPLRQSQQQHGLDPDVTYSIPDKTRSMKKSVRDSETTQAVSPPPPPPPPPLATTSTPSAPAPPPALVPPVKEQTDTPTPKKKKKKRKMPRGLAAIVIQAHWRGYITRKRLAEEKQKEKEKRDSQIEATEQRMSSLFTPPPGSAAASPANSPRASTISAARPNLESSFKKQESFHDPSPSNFLRSSSMLSDGSDGDVGATLSALKKDIEAGKWEYQSPEPTSSPTSPSGQSSPEFGFGNSPIEPSPPQKEYGFLSEEEDDDVPLEDHPFADDLKADFSNPLIK